MWLRLDPRYEDGFGGGRWLAKQSLQGDGEVWSDQIAACVDILSDVSTELNFDSMTLQQFSCILSSLERTHIVSVQQ